MVAPANEYVSPNITTVSPDDNDSAKDKNKSSGSRLDRFLDNPTDLENLMPGGKKGGRKGGKTGGKGTGADGPSRGEPDKPNDSKAPKGTDNPDENNSSRDKASVDGEGNKSSRDNNVSETKDQKLPDRTGRPDKTDKPDKASASDRRTLLELGRQASETVKTFESHPVGRKILDGSLTGRPNKTDASEKTDKPNKTDAPEKTDKPNKTDAPNKTDRPAEATNNWNGGKKNAISHYNKHKNDFPQYKNVAEYQQATLAFLKKNPSEDVRVKELGDGKKIVYESSTNTFGVRNGNGKPSTMFKPDAGESYFNKQPGKEKPGPAR